MAKDIRTYGSTRDTGTVDDGGPTATAEEVERFHMNADTDIRPEALHHTLGSAPGQASPGDHKHDGSDSELLLAGTTLTGSRGGNIALQSVIAALVRLGAQDSTTP